jgi:hypothetical protein
MSSIPIIFSHYGNASYLDYTLACAHQTNPNTRLIFLGDASNVNIAIKNGWEHFNYLDFRSKLQQRFNDVFQHIQGKKHTHIKNGNDWLRYVFERWFFIEAFATLKSINRFWHFDSDTMILKNLEPFNLEILDMDFTVQCNGTCLNGIVTTEVVTEFCHHINNLFEDKIFLQSQQSEFDKVNPEWAFTEMRAFDDYKKKTLRQWCRIMNFIDERVFDDCICQEHGFRMCTLKSGERVKDLFGKEGQIYGIRGNRNINFVTLNLSWVPDYVFSWTLDALSGKDSHLKDTHCTTWLQLIGYVKRVKRLVNNYSRMH